MGHHEDEDRSADQPDRQLSTVVIRRPRTARRRALSGERGAGLFGTWFGMIVVLVLLLFAVQVLFDLYARSVVTATAYDAARQVAGSHRGSVEAARADAEANARDLLGRYGSRVRFRWSTTDPDTVRLRVTVDNPRVGLAGVSTPLLADHLDRTVTVRVERPQP
jgi:hypothetical protein